MTAEDARLLVCPVCRARLVFHGTRLDGELCEGELACVACPHRWPVGDGLPRLVDEARVAGPDWLMRLIYDNFAVLHDPAVRLLLPLLQCSTAAALRDGYMPRLELRGLRRHGAR